MDDPRDLGFTFDPKPFLSGLKNVSGGLSKVEHSTEGVAKKMGGAIMGAIIKVKLLGAAFHGFVGIVKQYVPEIGQVFGIAKDVVLKNFLWPLRQAMAPYLQKLLDWVRDNRAMFVKWGQVVANVFNVVVMAVKNLWTIAKQVWSIIESLVKSVTGGSIGDVVNLIITKIAIVASFLSRSIGKILDWLQDLAPTIAPLIKDMAALAMEIGKIAWEALKSFFSGLADWVKPAVTAFDAIVRSVDTLLNQIFGGDGGGLNGFFHFLGEFTGQAIIEALKALKDVLDTIIAIVDWIKGDKAGLDAYFKAHPSPYTVAGSGEMAKVVSSQLKLPGADLSVGKTEEQNYRSVDISHPGLIKPLADRAARDKMGYSFDFSGMHLSVPSADGRVPGIVLDNMTQKFREAVMSSMVAQGLKVAN